MARRSHMPFSKLDSCVCVCVGGGQLHQKHMDIWGMDIFLQGRWGATIKRRESRCCADTSQNFPYKASAMGTPTLECSIMAQSGIHIPGLKLSTCETLSKSLDLSILSTMSGLEIDRNHQRLIPLTLSTLCLGGPTRTLGMLIHADGW